jgi:hypothetical protein
MLNLDQDITAQEAQSIEDNAHPFNEVKEPTMNIKSLSSIRASLKRNATKVSNKVSDKLESLADSIEVACIDSIDEMITNEPAHVTVRIVKASWIWIQLTTARIIRKVLSLKVPKQRTRKQKQRRVMAQLTLSIIALIVFVMSIPMILVNAISLATFFYYVSTYKTA